LPIVGGFRQLAPARFERVDEFQIARLAIDGDQLDQQRQQLVDDGPECRIGSATGA
jgi:hypothetical protein